MDAKEIFTGKSELYTKYRPSYPVEYIDYLVSRTNLNDNSVIADVGSGTGILTRLLLQRGLHVIAVEPNDDMRKIAENELNIFPGFVSVKAFAEDTSIREQSVDLVIAAQAFHWFNLDKFRQECRRILKPEGRVALVWNHWDENTPMIREKAQICRTLCRDFSGFSGGDRDLPKILSFFQEGKYEYREFCNDLHANMEDFVGRALSASYAPVETDPSFQPFKQAMMELFLKYGNNGEIVEPNLTFSYIGTIG